MTEKPLTVAAIHQLVGIPMIYAHVTSACQDLYRKGQLQRTTGDDNRYQYALAPAKLAKPAKPRVPRPLVAIDPLVLRQVLLSAVQRNEAALQAHLATTEVDPVLSALIAANQMSWRAAAAAGVLS